MAYRSRHFFTDKQKSEIWDRWQRGESMSSIGRGFDRASSSIYPLLARTGGIRPPDRMRSRLALSLAEREEISRGLTAQLTVRSIARSLKRSASTISREIRRNGGAKLYRAAQSDAAAWARAHRPKPCKLAGNIYLCRVISAKLTRKWSPQQIAGWLMREHPDEEDKRVSHETIYRSLFIQTRGVLKKELLSHLRATRSIRRSRHATMKRSGLGQIKDTISIRERPADVEERAVPGHWPLGDAYITCQLTGRRFDRRFWQQLRCHIGRATHALCDACQGWQQRQSQRCSGADQASSQATKRTLPFTDMGSWKRDGGAQEVYLGD